MAKPTTRAELLAEIDKAWSALEKYLATLTDAQMHEPDIVGHWSVKDVLAHLAAWAGMVQGWYAAGLRGENPPVPAEGYTWRQTPELNQAIYAQHRDRPLADVQADYRAGHTAMLRLIDSIADEVLFGKGHFAWTRDNTLSSYINSATAAHYRWARREIRKGFREKAG